MDAGGAVATALWGSFPLAGGMHGGMHGDGSIGGLQTMSSAGPSFAPQWSSTAAAFGNTAGTSPGRFVPDQPSASPRALPNVSPDRTFPPTEARPPQTSADEQMQSTFGTKLSLDDLLGGANGSGGGDGTAAPAVDPSMPAPLPLFVQPGAVAPRQAGRLMKKSGSDEDVFSAVGGMELGRHDAASATAAAVASAAVPLMQQSAGAAAVDGAAAPPGLEPRHVAADSRNPFSAPAIGDLPFSETPSRTLIVRNVGPSRSDEDLQHLFEAFGEIRTLYTACKQRGLVTVNYYDLRAACLALHSLAGTALGDSTLDVQYPVPSEQSVADREDGVMTVYNLDPSISLDELYHSFVTFGDVKDIRDLPGRVNSKVIEFYDVRHAAAAFKALHRSGSKTSLDHSSALPSVPELSSTAMHSPASQENLAGWMGPSSIDSARSSQDRLATMYSADSIKSAGAPSQLGTSSLDGRLGSGLLPGQAPYSHAHQDALQQARVLTSISADGLLAGAGTAKAGGGAGPGLEPQSSYGSYGGDGPGGYGAADALAALGRMQSGGSLAGDGHVLRSPGHGGQYLQQNSLQSAFGSAAAQQLHAIGSGAMGSRGMSMSTGDIASALEAQQQHQQLLQRRVSAAVPDASAMWSSHSAGLMAAGSSSPGTSPSGLGVDSVAWAAMRQQQQQQQQQHQQAAQLGQAQRIHAALIATPGLQHVTLEQVHALLVSGGLNAALPGVLMRSQSASAMMQHQLAPLAARQAAMLNKVGSASVMGRLQLGRSGSRDRDLGGRAARRSADSVADMERRSAQERMFALDLDKVLKGEDTRTTLMIKNIPNKYTQKMLLAAIDESFRGTYDFFYLPIDFKNKCNVGYAFINMIRPVFIIGFVDRFNYRKWEKFNSEKVCQISYARIQGKQAMVQHFQNSSLLQEDKRCRPVLFHSSGPNAGEAEPFPMGPAVRTRARGPSREGSRDLKLGGMWG